MLLLLFVCAVIIVLSMVLYFMQRSQTNMSIHSVYLPQDTTTHTKVPLKIHQTVRSRDMDSAFYIGVIVPNMEKNQDFQFEFYDNDRVANLIQCHFPERVHQAFCKINPKYGASIGDFARYCILYLYGGVYLDIKSHIKKPLGPFLSLVDTLPGEDVLLVSHWRDVAPHKRRYPPRGEIQNWVMVATPRHPVLQDIIGEMTERIHSNKEGIGKDTVLELTGPLLMTDVILKNKDRVYISDIIHDYFEYTTYADACYGDCRQLFYDASSTVPYDQITENVVLEPREIPPPHSCTG